MKKYKSFFAMTKYETIRVMRNKVILFTLLGFAIVILLIISFLSTDEYDVNACMYTNGENIEELKVVRFLETKMNINEVLIVDSMEEGLTMVKKNECQIFIYFDTSDYFVDFNSSSNFFSSSNALYFVSSPSISFFKMFTFAPYSFF